MTNTMRLRTPRCPVCNATAIIEVETEAFGRWQAGALIQDAFPTLTSAQREQILTGYDEECWDALFSEDDENDELKDENVGLDATLHQLGELNDHEDHTKEPS